MSIRLYRVYINIYLYWASHVKYLRSQLNVFFCALKRTLQLTPPIWYSQLFSNLWPIVTLQIYFNHLSPFQTVLSASLPFSDSLSFVYSCWGCSAPHCFSLWQHSLPLEFSLFAVRVEIVCSSVLFVHFQSVAFLQTESMVVRHKHGLTWSASEGGVLAAFRHVISHAWHGRAEF